MFRVRGDLKRHLKIHLRLIEKEQKLKDSESVIVDSMAIYNENSAALVDGTKPIMDNDAVKPNIIYGNAANNGDMFSETSNLLSEAASVTMSNNNVENANFRSPRKRKPKAAVKQKKVKIQDIGGVVHDNLSVFQLPSTVGSIQNSETLVTSIPVVDLNKILSKSSDKVDGVTVSGSDEQYQIYLLGA